MKAFVEKNKLAAFIVFAYGFSWLCWSPIIHVVKANLFASPVWAIGLLFLGGYGPTLSALLVIAITGGRASVKALLKKLFNWRVGFNWYAIIFLVWPIIFALGAGLYVKLGGNLGATNYGLLPWIPAVYMVSIFLGPLAEELGWRGFAMPILYEKYGFVGASFILGIVWAMWHAPLFWAATGTAVSGLDVSFTNVVLFVLWTIGASVIHTWLYKNTYGSVLVAVLLHLSTNASGTVFGLLFPDVSIDNRQVIYYYTLAVLWLLILLGAGCSYFHKKLSNPYNVHIPISVESKSI
jgi:uncharacterized protein